MPKDVIEWYGHYLRNRIVTTKIAGCQVTRRVRRGTPQGGVLSPVIWNVVFEPLLKAMNVHGFVTGFADDGSVIVTGTDRHKCR